MCLLKEKLKRKLKGACYFKRFVFLLRKRVWWKKIENKKKKKSIWGFLKRFVAKEMFSPVFSRTKQ